MGQCRHEQVPRLRFASLGMTEEMDHMRMTRFAAPMRALLLAVALVLSSPAFAGPNDPWTLMAVRALHVAAVVHHDLFRRDGIFRRMSPFTR